MNLKEIRKVRGFTQKQLAQRMAMEQTTHSKKENGKSPISEDEYKKLAAILETSIEELKKEMPSSTKNENCTFNDQSIGIQIVSMPKDALDIMLKYTAKLENEVNFLKGK